MSMHNTPPAPIISSPILGLFVYLSEDDTYYARWTTGSTHGHSNATIALLWGLSLMN